MVTLNRIYTRTGDAGQTRLASGAPVSKTDPRVEAYGAVDELNAVVGVARLHSGQNDRIDAMLARIQNELFDLGADLATPLDPPPKWEALRIVASQVERLESEIDWMNESLKPLDSFILPAGTPLATHLHLARTVARAALRDVAVVVGVGAGRAHAGGSRPVPLARRRRKQHRVQARRGQRFVHQPLQLGSPGQPPANTLGLPTVGGPGGGLGPVQQQGFAGAGGAVPGHPLHAARPGQLGAGVDHVGTVVRQRPVPAGLGRLGQQSQGQHGHGAE